MSYNKRLKWKDHWVKRPRTYTEAVNRDGSKTFTPAPGEVLQQGTPLSASNLNRIEEGIQHISVAFDYFTTLFQATVRHQVTSVNGQTGDVTLKKENIGLGNVPNVATEDQTPAFTQGTSRSNIASGDTLSTMLGKISRWFADLKNVAFTGRYSDLTGTPTIPEAVSVKGNAESAYRTGDVNLTPQDIGALPDTGGTVSGHIAVRSGTSTSGGTDAYVSVTNTDTGQSLSLSSGTDGSLGLYSGSKNKWLFHLFPDDTFTLNGVYGPFLQKEAAAAMVAHTLTFTGAVKGSYDGSANKTVNIPEEVSVKGNAESAYRTGKVNLTPKDIGALPTTGGVLSGHISVQAGTATSGGTEAYVGVFNTDTEQSVSLSSGTDGSLGLYSGSKNKWLFHLFPDDTFTLNGVYGPFLQKEAAAAKVAHALTFTGAVEGSYDGSANKTVNIPEPSLYMEEIGGVHLMGASEKFDDLGSGMFRWTTALTDTTKPFPSGVGIAINQSENQAVQIAFRLGSGMPKIAIRTKTYTYVGPNISTYWNTWYEINVGDILLSSDEPLPGPEIMAEGGQDAE